MIRLPLPAGFRKKKLSELRLRPEQEERERTKDTNERDGFMKLHNRICMFAVCLFLVYLGAAPILLRSWSVNVADISTIHEPSSRTERCSLKPKSLSVCSKLATQTSVSLITLPVLLSSPEHLLVYLSNLARSGVVWKCVFGRKKLRFFSKFKVRNLTRLLRLKPKRVATKIHK